MVDKLNKKKVALSLAIVSGIVYLACAILIAIAPAWTIRTFGALFHGIDISQIARSSVPIISTILGLAEIAILGLVVGWLFSSIYNKIK